MDEPTQAQLRRLGFKPGASGTSQCWLKTRKCMMYRNAGDTHWRVNMVRAGEWSFVSLFDDPISAAVWLNVELSNG